MSLNSILNVRLLHKVSEEVTHHSVIRPREVVFLRRQAHLLEEVPYLLRFPGWPLGPTFIQAVDQIGESLNNIVLVDRISFSPVWRGPLRLRRMRPHMLLSRGSLSSESDPEDDFSPPKYYKESSDNSSDSGYS